MTVRCSAYFVVDSLIRRAEGRKPPVSACCNSSFCLGDFFIHRLSSLVPAFISPEREGLLLPRFFFPSSERFYICSE